MNFILKFLLLSLFFIINSCGISPLSKYSDSDLALAIKSCEEKWAKKPDPDVGNIKTVKRYFDEGFTEYSKVLPQRMKKMTREELLKSYPAIKKYININDIKIRNCFVRITLSERDQIVNDFLDKLVTI
ncbi:MAG: hypothetical protein KC505_00940 [Myxococcales bacterium]|nr:hypothetical protein [Myxococcales bacterium]USN50340.1 MAG: hypothetical protein H6731_08745 [Myxococcales bacterium]